MERYAQGEEAAFADLYDELAPPLYRYALMELGSGGAAEDIVQQTFLQICRARDRFVRGSAVRPWAYAIARRLIIDGWRHAAYEARLRADGHGAEPVTNASPEELLDRRRRERELRLALQLVPGKHRAAFTLVKLDGLSVAEAADVLGITKGMVKIRTHRATKALRLADARRRRT